METRNVGSSSLEVSQLGLGTVDFGGRLDESSSRALVDQAIESGITFFDTGDNYQDGLSEEILGRALRSHRNKVQIATKFTGGGQRFRADGSRDHVIAACEGSLRRLGIECIDLYAMHHPDPGTPIEETLHALDALVAEGKVREVGSSNFSGWQIAEADHIAKENGLSRFVGCQMEWNLLKRHVEDEIVPACLHYDVGIMPFYPIASGLLTGKYASGKRYPEGSRFADVEYYARVASERNFSKVDALTDFAERHGRSLLELAMSWLSGQPGVSTILVGASRPEQLRKNVAAIEWAMTQEERDGVDALLSDIRDPGELPFNHV